MRVTKGKSPCRRRRSTRVPGSCRWRSGCGGLFHRPGSMRPAARGRARARGCPREGVGPGTPVPRTRTPRARSTRSPSTGFSAGGLGRGPDGPLRVDHRRPRGVHALRRHPHLCAVQAGRAGHRPGERHLHRPSGDHRDGEDWRHRARLEGTSRARRAARSRRAPPWTSCSPAACSPTAARGAGGQPAAEGGGAGRLLPHAAGRHRAAGRALPVGRLRRHGWPAGRVLVQGGFVQGAASPGHAAADPGLRRQAGQRAVRAGPDPRKAVAYVSPRSARRPCWSEAPRGPTAQSWCGVPRFGYKWCRKPTNVTFTDFTTTRWPVGDAMNAWMYTSVSNSLYLNWRGSGTPTSWSTRTSTATTAGSAYTWNYASGSCITGSIVN